LDGQPELVYVADAFVALRFFDLCFEFGFDIGEPAGLDRLHLEEVASDPGVLSWTQSAP
jgi:hypothetical protein